MLIKLVLVFACSYWTSACTKDNLVQAPMLENGEHPLFLGIIILAVEPLVVFQDDVG